MPMRMSFMSNAIISNAKRGRSYRPEHRRAVALDLHHVHDTELLADHAQKVHGARLTEEEDRQGELVSQ